MLQFLNLEMGMMSVRSIGGAGESSDEKDCFPGPPASLWSKKCKMRIARREDSTLAEDAGTGSWVVQKVSEGSITESGEMKAEVEKAVNHR